MSAVGRRSVAAAVLVTAALAAGPVASATPTSPAALPEPTTAQLAAAVVRFTTTAQLAAAVVRFTTTASVRQFTLAGAVQGLAREEVSGGETTITLATDVLFAPDAWDLPPSATEQIGALVADIPEGGAVTIAGHTDSVVGAVDNLELSQHRADAVAALVVRQRPDLSITVEAYGPTRPAVREDPQDPATFAQNRRVEIIHRS